MPPSLFLNSERKLGESDITTEWVGEWRSFGGKNRETVRSLLRLVFSESRCTSMQRQYLIDLRHNASQNDFTSAVNKNTDKAVKFQKQHVVKSTWKCCVTQLLSKNYNTEYS